MEPVSTALTGGNGGVLINDTSLHNAKTDRQFIAIQAITESVLDSSEMGSADDTNIDDFDIDLTLPAGVILYGRFTKVQLTSGTVVAYYQ